MNSPIAPDSSVDWSLEPDVPALGRAVTALKGVDPQAVGKLELLADSSSSQSMLWLAAAYRQGLVVGRDPIRAEAWYRRALGAGSLEASYLLGGFYQENGRYQEAAETYRIGASQTFLPSMVRLGVLYLRGTGVDSDVDKAIDLLECAAKRGHVLAKGLLVHIILKYRFGPATLVRATSLTLSGLIDGVKIRMRDPQSDLLR